MRGSLDVLLATPLSTASIIIGKWRGTFRLTPLVLFWPILVCYSQVIHILPSMLVFLFYMILLDATCVGRAYYESGVGLGSLDGATSKPLGMVVMHYAGQPCGIPLIVDGTDQTGWMAASPFMGMGMLSGLLENRNGSLSDPLVSECGNWSIVYGISAAVLYLAVRLSFRIARGWAVHRNDRESRDWRHARVVETEGLSGHDANC